MKNTGIIRRIDDLGRIVIPREIRINMGIKEGDALEMFIMNNNIMLVPIERHCAYCNTLIPYEEHNGLCTDCHNILTVYKK